MNILPKISQRVALHTENQTIISVEIPSGESFEPQIDESTENTAVIMKGTGKIQIGNETRTIKPISLCRANEIKKIFNEQLEPLNLYWIVAKGKKEDTNHKYFREFYLRKKEECFEIVATEKERIYELFGENNGHAQTHSVAIVDIHPDGASDEHYHPVVEEIYLTTQGTGKLIIDSQETLIKAGDASLIPIGKKHQIFNVGKETLQLVVICVPYWTQDCGIYTKSHVQ